MVPRVSTANQLVQDAWRDGRCPYIDGVLFSDGRIILHDVTHEASGRVTVTPLLASTIESYVEFNKDSWNSPTATTSLAIRDSLRTVAGEGSWGSDGFVALCDGESLVWGVFSRWCNPVSKVSYEQENNTVVARTTSGNVWRIPLDRPGELEIGFSPR